MQPMALLKMTLEFAVAMNILTLQQEKDPEVRRQRAWQWAGGAVEILSAGWR